MYLEIYDLTEEVKNNSKLLEALYYFVDNLGAGAMRHTSEKTLLYIAWEEKSLGVSNKKKYEEILEDTRELSSRLFDRQAIKLVHDMITNPETKSDYMYLTTT